MLSQATVDSINCQAELNKPVLPLMLAECDYPESLGSRRIQYEKIDPNMPMLRVLVSVLRALTQIQTDRAKGHYTPLHAHRPDQPGSDPAMADFDPKDLQTLLVQEGDHTATREVPRATTTVPMFNNPADEADPVYNALPLPFEWVEVNRGIVTLHHKGEATQVCPVTDYENGASPFGVMHMAGNVWERCLNDYHNVENLNIHDDQTRVLRGRAWVNFETDALRSTSLSGLRAT